MCNNYPNKKLCARPQSPKIYTNSTNTQWAKTPAMIPPAVWQRIALPVSCLEPRLSIMAT